MKGIIEMLKLYYLIYYYQCYFLFYLPQDIAISSLFKKRKLYRKTHKLSSVQKDKKNLLKRINEVVSDNAFFRWLKNHNLFFKQYEKNIVKDPHISIVVKDAESQDYEVYRQINKKKYSRMV